MSWLHTHLVMPWAEPERHAGLPGRLRAIRNFERLTESAQRKHQQDRLRALLEHAYNTVPFYRRQFDEAGFSPSEARTDRPLPLPVLTRDDLRSQSDTLVSRAYKREDLRMAASSGTTSTPIQFYRNIEGLRDKTALNLHLNACTGYEAGDSVLMLWGAHRDLAMHPSWRWRLYEEGLMRRIPAPSGLITDEILERFRLRYEKHRPKVLYAYSTVLAAFASYLEKHGMRHRPKVIIATAEVLSDPNRKLVESVFGVPLYTHYGSREVGMIGTECSVHGGLHFHPWGCHLEFDPIGETPDGPAYRLLVTDLLNYGQPLIRYDTGDCVTLTEQPCRCGSWFPLVQKILGRVGGGIVLADGGVVPSISVGTQMALMGHTFRAIAQVQFVQRSHEHLHLRYVAKDGNTAAPRELQSICDAIDSLVNRPMRWTTEMVANIPREQSGKIRLCVSEIDAANSGLAATLGTKDELALTAH